MKRIIGLTFFSFFILIAGLSLANKSFAVINTLPAGTFTSTEWIKLDTAGNKVEIDTNKNLILTPGTVAAWNAGLISDKQITNVAGNQIYAILKTGAGAPNYTMVGFGKNQTTNASYTVLTHALFFGGGALYVYQNGANVGTVGLGYAPETVYEVLITINANKSATYKIKGGTYQNWTTLLAADGVIADATFRAQVAQYQNSMTFSQITDVMPTPTPIDPNHPPSENIMAVPLTGTGDLCESETISTGVMPNNGFLTVTSNAKNGDMVAFGYAFYNMDNLDAAGKPKPIIFTTVPYSVGREFAVSRKSLTINVNFSDVDFKDTSWNYYMPKPKNIRVDAYFKNTAGTWSQVDKKCQVTFKMNSIDPTPTPNAACVCAAAGTCSTACFFDKFATTTTSPYAYSNPIKCSLGADLFMSTPAQADKDKWCRNYYRTKGDANGDGKATLMDYFYFLSARSGQNLPPSVNVDFDGDGYVTEGRDRAVIMQSLIP